MYRRALLCVWPTARLDSVARDDLQRTAGPPPKQLDCAACPGESQGCRRVVHVRQPETVDQPRREHYPRTRLGRNRRPGRSMAEQQAIAIKRETVTAGIPTRASAATVGKIDALDIRWRTLGPKGLEDP